jgi:hypothetical protein
MGDVQPLPECIDRPHDAKPKPSLIEIIFRRHHSNTCAIPVERARPVRNYYGSIETYKTSMRNQPKKTNLNNPPTNRETGQEKINYRSPDGLFEIVTKTQTAKRFPPHGYPIVCLRLRPQPGSRIQQLDDEGGLDVLLSHKEVSEHLRFLNVADAKAAYTWKEIPEKSAERKAQWGHYNAQRRNHSR